MIARWLCRQMGTHFNAKNIIAFIKSEGGITTKTNGEIRELLGLSAGDWHNAWRHAVHAIGPTGELCFPDMWHYRNGALSLISTDVSLPELVLALESGSDYRLRVNETINQRLIEEYERLERVCMAKGQPTGSRLCQRIGYEIEGTGAISSKTRSEWDAWVATLASE